MKRKELTGILVCFVLLLFAMVSWAVPLPDTGQIKCYNATDEIPCPSPGQPFYGQDANYTIHPMSYTKLDDNGNILPDSASSWAMVKDNVTGLIWEVKTSKDGIIKYNDPHDADNTYTWYDSNPATNGGNPGTPGTNTDTEDFIKALNAVKYGGFSDWRLPTIKELAYISDYSIPYPGPTINSKYFLNTASSWYWSSTSLASNPGSAWGLRSNFGGINFDSKSNNFYVRGVRGGQTAADSYVDNGDGTITDLSTGLMWQKASVSNKTWEQALAECEGLNLGGYTDWRLPNFKELRSLVDNSRYNPAINTTYFPDTVSSSIYWSSTSQLDHQDGAWVVHSYDGNGFFDNGNKISNNYVRAVRGGQAQVTRRFLGAWSDGVWSWNQSTKKWTKIASTASALMIAAGDVDGDKQDDLIGVWSSGLWVLQSKSSQWVKLSTALPTWIAVGDMNNDGKDDVIGTWPGDGTYYRDSATGKWVKITTPAKQLAAGNVHGDNRDDLVGVWIDGLWARYSATSAWQKIDPTISTWIAVGDMTGNGRADIVGSYSSGTWYRNSATGGWVNITTPAQQLAVGDIDGDGRDDIIGVWSDGVWVKYGATSKWEHITSNKPTWISTGNLASSLQSVSSQTEGEILDLSNGAPGLNEF